MNDSYQLLLYLLHFDLQSRLKFYHRTVSHTLNYAFFEIINSINV